MKKILALILTCLMLIGMVSTTLAYDEEITWQGIPWGSSVEEVKSLLVEKQIISDESEIKLDEGYNQIFLMDSNGSEIGLDLIDSTIPYVETISLDQPQILVSGYSVKRICFIFVKEGENTQLINIGIAFSEKGIYKNLQKTVTSTYGKGKKDKNIFGQEYIMVEGANKTAVSLFKMSIVFDETLLYGKLDGLEMIESLTEDSSSENGEKMDVGI